MLSQQYICGGNHKTSGIPAKSYDIAVDPNRTFGPKVETSFPTFDPKVPTFPTFGPKIKRPPRQQTIYKWLRDRISGIDIGVEIEDDKCKHPIHINTNTQVLDHFERVRNEQPSFLTRLNNMCYVDHFTNEATYYFAGASEPKKPESLVMIDIDCKKTGSLDGAMAFARHLRENHFANLYIEVSTHGRGAHGLFVLEKYDFGAEYINKLLLHRLQPWLRQILKEHEFDVENVEIKGTLPVIVWGREKLEVTNYRAGTLAKLPRLGTSPDKEDALRNTTRVSSFDLQKLPIIERAEPESSGVIRIGGGVAGSVSGKVISEDELDNIDGHYGDVAAALLESHDIRTKGRTVVTNEDVAISLLLLKFFTENMNSDGTLPVKRWKVLWQALFEAGDINRAFCPQRFKAIRVHLSSLELLDWQDRTYQLGWLGDDGQYRKGKAAKWKASYRLMEMLNVPAEQEDYKDGEGETSFIRTQLLYELESIVQQPLDETIRPVQIEFDHHLRLNPDDITRLITPFDVVARLAA